MIKHGDLFDVLPTITAESVDALVTDPPYGIGFMAKKWDTFAPGLEADRERASETADSENPNLKGRTRAAFSSPSSVDYNRSLEGQREFQAWCERWGREVLRVLKPGAHAVICGAPRSFHRLTSGLEDAGFEIRDCWSWLFGQGYPKSLNLDDNHGTALKPAWEPIILARKPLDGTVAEAFATFGTGVLNVGACRLDSGDDAVGRWPPNVVMDETVAALLDAEVGDLTSGANPLRGGADGDRRVYGAHAAQEQTGLSRGLDVGGPSRFFYVPKPSRMERDQGCHDLAGKPRDETRKAGKVGGDNPRNRGLQLRGNFHPTVKPVELMRWLVMLITPPGGLVLDPFAGSGTTGMACRYEDRKFIGIEREAEYVEIAERRIASVSPLFAGLEQESK